ncbi:MULTISPECIES: hypothetical protein [Streptomyces violaceusniger group]|uniref:hypothetical protein n=1 Tax=Streptomyces violaceusniger group TaxID=2839105 RepID=UPI001BACBE54|nr:MULTISPECIES: hypothetical protein [Streptomyces violaceusniger group]
MGSGATGVFPALLTGQHGWADEVEDFNHIVDAPIGRLPLNVIGDDHLRDWKKELKSRGLADSTNEVIWNHLSSVFKAAVRVVGALMPPVVPLLGEIRTEPSGEPDRALAAGVAWVRQHCERVGLAVVCVGNLNGQHPASVRPYQGFARVTVGAARAMRELPPKLPENSLAR